MSTLEEITIAMSHEDFDTWSTLTVGFNYTKSLVICLTFYDYKNVQHHTYAIIEKDEAMAMSEHLDVKLTDLPQTICKHCGDTSYVFVPSHVEELFKDVLDFILTKYAPTALTMLSAKSTSSASAACCAASLKAAASRT